MLRKHLHTRKIKIAILRKELHEAELKESLNTYHSSVPHGLWSPTKGRKIRKDHAVLERANVFLNVQIALIIIRTASTSLLQTLVCTISSRPV